jgi:general secretion pathway protein L
MLPELITWWSREMGDLAAPLLRRAGKADPDAMLLFLDQAGLRIEHRRNGRSEAVGSIPDGVGPAALQALIGRRRRDPFVLVLPLPLLICEASLPAAAQASLDRVVRYEMDRLTPFESDDVYCAHRTLGLDRAGALRVELAIMPRTLVQPLLDRLGHYGVVPASLEAAAPDGGIRRISIAPPDPVRLARTQMFSRLAAAACCGLASAIVAVPLLRQSLALADAEDSIAALRPRVEQAEALRKRITQGSAGAGRIAAARRQAGLPLQVLRVLTDTLPDDTWLTSLALHQRTIVMEGHSAAATRLIAALAAEPRLRDPAFAAPVLRGENGSEVFTIQAGLGF